MIKLMFKSLFILRIICCEVVRYLKFVEFIPNCNQYQYTLVHVIALR